MLKTIIKLIVLFLAATILHWFFLAMFGTWGISVNVMLVCMVALCTCLPPAYGYTAAFVGGLFLDFFGVKLFGHNAFMFTVCAMIVYGLKQRLDFDSIISQMVCIAALCVLAAAGNGLLLKNFSGFSAWNGWAAWLGGLVISTLLAPVIFWAVRRLFRKIKTY